MKKSVMAAGAALVVGAMTVSGVASAPVLSDFTVDAHRFSPVRRPRLLVADKLTGNYNEVKGHMNSFEPINSQHINGSADAMMTP